LQVIVVPDFFLDTEQMTKVGAGTPQAGFQAA
jgi:hypothetical protein